MADSKISALTAAAAALTTHELEVNESGASKKITTAQLMALFGDSVHNESSAAQAITAATLTYITGSGLVVPVGLLRVGTTFHWRLDMTKTAAGTAARNFFLKIGTAGTTADATILTFGASVVPTAAVDTAWADVMVTIRGPLSASCICRGLMRMGHKLATTGFANQTQDQVFDVTSSAFDATVANLVVGLAVTTGAAEAITIQQCASEAKNL